MGGRAEIGERERTRERYLKEKQTSYQLLVSRRERKRGEREREREILRGERERWGGGQR